MANVSAPFVPLPPTQPDSPPKRGLKKILSVGRRSSEAQSDGGNNGPRSSIDSLRLDQSSTFQSTRSTSQDGSTKSGSSGMRKLIPGHAKRKRERARDQEFKVADEELARGRRLSSEIPVQRPSVLGRSTSSLLTDDSELESPSVLSNEVSAGYLSTYSPMIKATTVRDLPGEDVHNLNVDDPNGSVTAFPAIVKPNLETSPSPKSSAVSLATSSLASPGLIDKADMLRVEPVKDRRGSISKLRGKSPARKFKDVFTKSGRSPKTSPERPVINQVMINPPAKKDVLKASPNMWERRQIQNAEKRGLSPIRTQTTHDATTTESQAALPNIRTEISPPMTPPSAILKTPLTTVTPPTPTDSDPTSPSPSPGLDLQERAAIQANDNNGTVVSPSGNMISHRRARSNSSITHQKSKLSTSTMAPLTPTAEEVKSPVEKQTGTRNLASGSFFSSWVTAAQTAATNLTNLTNQNRSRAGTDNSESIKAKPSDETTQDQQEPVEPEVLQKKMAVETLGSGELKLSHLGFEANGDGFSSNPARSDLLSRRHDSVLKRDEEAAKIEDILAKRAVSQAYELDSKANEGTPVAELPDPIGNIRGSQTFESGTAGTLTPSNGSVFEGDTGTIKRSNSVRSKSHHRRSRGSSITTGLSSVGAALVSASTITLANPASGPRLTAFTTAPKQRNRAFHQQFRSVPDDDYLVEDYSCALQKEILLAGRIYISEGHICFSSNILGWVTTLIISFEEVVSIEKEMTAIVIPNAIAVQTLHARHTFRSLLSREATYDLLIGIWKVSHPDSFQKSVNGKLLAAEDAKSQTTPPDANDQEAEDSDADSDEDSDSDEEDDEGSVPSVVGSSGSMIGSDSPETKTVTRKSSAMNGSSAPTTGVAVTTTSSDTTTAVTVATGPADATADFPGPPTHAPSDCNDKATHYDKIVKDEIIPAPLGKIYSLLYGPQSGTFMRRFLEDGVSKAQDLQMEDDKKGLNNEIKTRQYRYIKPLGGSIGPKQTTCITTEVLDAFDLEKVVSVSCSTQTPDVPSGSAFSTKTRYCLTWAPDNMTRLQMNMTIEWTAKSWLKGPIEKGASDGQQQYGDDLVKTLKGALGRSRAATTGSKTAKGKKKRKGEKRGKSEKVAVQVAQAEDWGMLDFLRPVLGPVYDIVRPIFRLEGMMIILTIMVFWMWLRGGKPTKSIGYNDVSRTERFAAYDQLWQKEESDLWDWLEDRVGMDSVIGREGRAVETAKLKAKQRQKLLKSKDVLARVHEEGKTKREMEDAIRVTRERLEQMQAVMARQL